MPLTTVSETYLAGLNSSLTIGSIATCVEDGSYRGAVKTDETTKNCSGGFYEDVATIKKYTGTFKCAFKAGTTPDLKVGSIYAIVLDSGVSGGPYLSGNVRISSREVPILNVQGGIHLTFSWTNQGVMYDNYKP